MGGGTYLADTSKCERPHLNSVKAMLAKATVEQKLRGRSCTNELEAFVFEHENDMADEGRTKQRSAHNRHRKAGVVAIVLPVILCRPSQT